MDCERWQDSIDAFVDTELSPSETRGFEEHLRTCAACAAETSARHRLKSEVHSAGKRFSPSYAFEQRMRRHVARPRTAFRPGWAMFAAVAAALVIAVAIGTVWYGPNAATKQFTAQLLDQHLAVLSANSIVPMTEEASVKAWFRGAVPFGVEVPDLDATRFKLVGVQRTYLQQAPVAQLLFGSGGHRISVFIFSDTAQTRALGEKNVPHREQGLQVETWSEDGLRYFAVGDASAEDVRQLCDLLKKT